MVAGQHSVRESDDDPLRELGTRFATDPAAFDEAYTALAPGIRRLLLRVLPADDADDVLQATFADAWRHRAGYDPSRPLGSWVRGIARRRCADARRAQKPLPVEDADALADVSPAGTDGFGPRPATDVAEQVARTELVRAALRTVSTQQREVLVLAYFRGMTQAEVADWLDLPLGTVKARSAAARGRWPGRCGGTGATVDAERPGEPAGRVGDHDGHLGHLVADLAGGSLGDADPALVLHHLADCEPCCADLADSVVAAAALRQLALSPLPLPLSIPTARTGSGVGTDPGVATSRRRDAGPTTTTSSRPGAGTPRLPGEARTTAPFGDGGGCSPPRSSPA